MNILLGFLVYLPAIFAGILLTHWMWRGSAPSQLLMKIGIGIGLGLGLSSLLYFLNFLLFNNGAGFVFIQGFLFVFSGIVVWRARKENPIFPLAFSFNRQQKFLLAAFGALVVISIGSYFIHALMNPHGGFDAWMIYNRIARFFFRDPIHWQKAFSPDIYWQFHADYPLFISLNVTGAWNILGSEIMRAPQAHGAYFLIGIVCLLMGATASARTTGQSILAGMTLLGVPAFIYEAPREAADLTLSFFVLAAIALLFLYHREEKNFLLFFAGFMSGLAAWTKNEGLLFVVAAWIVVAFLAYRRREWKILMQFALGAAFPLALVAYFKLFLAPSNDLFASTSQPSLFQLLTDKDRYMLILNEFTDHILWFGRSRFSVFAILLAYLLIVKPAPLAADRPAYLVCASILAIQFLGYFAIYVVTPHDLDWHLRTSLGRLIMHVFPATLFLFFASLTDPETVFAK